MKTLLILGTLLLAGCTVNTHTDQSPGWVCDHYVTVTHHGLFTSSTETKCTHWYREDNPHVTRGAYNETNDA